MAMKISALSLSFLRVLSWYYALRSELENVLFCNYFLHFWTVKLLCIAFYRFCSCIFYAGIKLSLRVYRACSSASGLCSFVQFNRIKEDGEKYGEGLSSFIFCLICQLREMFKTTWVTRGIDYVCWPNKNSWLIKFEYANIRRCVLVLNFT